MLVDDAGPDVLEIPPHETTLSQRTLVKQLRLARQVDHSDESSRHVVPPFLSLVDFDAPSEVYPDLDLGPGPSLSASPFPFLAPDVFSVSLASLYLKRTLQLRGHCPLSCFLKAFLEV
jgi:hypothetical protein